MRRLGSVGTVACMGGARGETERHRDLKRRALVWAWAHDFRVCGLEVRLPRSGFRADVAAATVPRGRDAMVGETVVFECKQARADLLRDSADERETRDRLALIAARRRDLECLVGAHLPNLRRGETLFPECDEHDFTGIRHDGLRRVRREEARLQSKLFGGTKFDRLCRYRCADRLYLVVDPAVMEPHEAPAGWGVLVAAGDGLEVARPPSRLACQATDRLALLQAIALAGTRACLTSLGVVGEELATHRRQTVPG